MRVKLKGKTIDFILLGALLCFVFFSTFSLHLDFRFPYHHDEWQHLGLSVQIMDQGYNRQFNPYTGEDDWHADLESGFHIFLAELFLITGVDPILAFQYLAASFAVLSGFIIYLCVSRLTKKEHIGLISLIVFSALKTNVNILGKDFFIPLSLGIPFMFMFILFFQESVEEKDMKKFILSVLILLILFTIHPPSALILILPAMLELLLDREFRNSLVRMLNANPLPAAAIIILVLLFSFMLFWKGSTEATRVYFFDLLVFEPGWGRLEVTYFIPLLYGLVSTLLAVLGFVYAYKTRMRYFIVIAFVSLATTSIFNMFGFTIFVPYARAVHYAILAMMPLTALGLYKLLDITWGSKGQKLVFHYAAYAVFFMIIISSGYSLDRQYKRYTLPVMTEQDYQSLLWFKSNIGQEYVLVTPYFMTSSVYPVSMNRVISIIPAQLEGGNIQDNLNFYTYDCDEKQRVMEETDAEYVYSRDELDCSFLSEIYSESGFFYSLRN